MILKKQKILKSTALRKKLFLKSTILKKIPHKISRFVSFYPVKCADFAF